MTFIHNIYDIFAWYLTDSWPESGDVMFRDPNSFEFLSSVMLRIRVPLAELKPAKSLKKCFNSAELLKVTMRKCIISTTFIIKNLFYRGKRI